jgi:glycosyltransferase involved in cell wall biosynthesis
MGAMPVSGDSYGVSDIIVQAGGPPAIVVGVTSSQACLVLGGRLRALREAGFRIILLASPGKVLNRMVANEGVAAVTLPISRKIAPFADIVTLVKLVRLLRRLKPVLTEFSTPKAGLLGSLAAKLCGVPVRVYMLRGLKLETSSGCKRFVLLAAERVAAACADVVLCNSESLRSKALALHITTADKLHVLGDGSSNGVDAERFSPGSSDVRQRYGIPQDAPVLGFAGRLTRDKGIPELVEAFDTILAKKPAVHMLLVGWFDDAEDALGDELRSRIMSHSHIHYTGFVDDTAPYYRAMDLMVLFT